MRYFAESLTLFNIEGYRGYLHFADYDKVFFILVNAPFSALIHLLGGSPALAMGLFPFFASLAFLLLIYWFIEKIGGERTAFWAGLVWAGLPSAVYYAADTAPHTFFIYFFILGCSLFYQYSETRKKIYLIFAASILFSLSKIRMDGLVIFVIFLAVLVYAERRAGLKNREIAGSVMLAGAVAVVLWLVYRSISTQIFGSGRGADYGQLVRLSLGYLTSKIDALFGVGTPGGFFEGNKLKYVVENPGLVFLVLLSATYDVLKTLLIVPFRLFPPLLLPFIGLAVGGIGLRDEKARIMLIFMALSLISILIYPLLWFSASRFAYLFVPVAIIVIAGGYSRAEEMIDNTRRKVGSFLSGRRILTVLTIVYFVFLNLQLVAAAMKSERDSAASYEPVREWLQKNFGDREIAIMCWSDIAPALGRGFIQFPIKVGRIDGKWRPLPISLSDVESLMNEKGNMLVIVSKEELYGKTYSGEEIDYFARSVAVNFPFIGDEGLENMDPRNRLGSVYFLQEFRLLVEGNIAVAGLTFVGKIEVSDEKRAYYIIATDEIAERLESSP
ncbi:MAG: hypothetical protein V1794_10080 [Candidatus Glassbacteria bacterium]